MAAKSKGEKQRKSLPQRDPKRAKNKPAALKTAEQLFARPERFQSQWATVTHVISAMRTGKGSLTRVSREFGIDPRTVVRLGGSAVRKAPNGRYTASKHDSLLRVMAIPTPHGMAEIALRDSRQASRLGQYSAALKRFLQTGDSSALLKFQGQSIKAADGTLVPLITDLKLLRRLGGAGVVSFEDLYGRTA